MRRDTGAPRRRRWARRMAGTIVVGALVLYVLAFRHARAFTRFVADIMDLVMTIIVAAGVLNTALMSVFERTREVGTLRAVGARRARVLAIFLIEAGLIGLFGAAGGAALGAGLVTFFGRVGIPAFSEAQRYSYGGDYLVPLVNWTDALTVPAVMLLVCVAAALGPALVAARMRPAEALRYV